MSVDTIKDAITRLSHIEQLQLAEWFDDWHEEEWDHEMERDFSPEGRAARLLERVDREIDAGHFTSLSSGLDKRRIERHRK